MRRMPRGEAVLSFVFASLVAACGGGDNNPDAQLVPTTDAPPPDASRPDAFVCTLTECGGECVDTSSDPDHCGGCDDACQSGAECVATDCVCPPSFLPENLNTGLQDIFIDQLPGANIWIRGFFGTALEGFGVGYGTTGVETGVAYTLNGATLPAPPFVLALHDIDIATMEAQSAYAAISGTITFTAACAGRIAGTLTNATFQAATINPAPQIDPDGCTFTVPSITFTIGDPACTDCSEAACGP
jgi:hypothetical protein